MSILLEQQLQDFNASSRAWARLTKSKLKSKLLGYGLSNATRDQGKNSLVKSLSTSTKTKNRQVSRIRFQFEVSGWFFEHGVGRGITLDRVASSARTAKPWMFIIDQEMQALADELSVLYGVELGNLLTPTEQSKS